MEYGDSQLLPARLARAAIARPRRQNPDCQYFFEVCFFEAVGSSIDCDKEGENFKDEFGVHDYTPEGRLGSGTPCYARASARWSVILIAQCRQNYSAWGPLRER
jgi:hypothetical protein